MGATSLRPLRACWRSSFIVRIKFRSRAPPHCVRRRLLRLWNSPRSTEFRHCAITTRIWTKNGGPAITVKRERRSRFFSAGNSRRAWLLRSPASVLATRLHIAGSSQRSGCRRGGSAGAAEVANAAWIELKPLRNQADPLAAQERYPLGLGPSSALDLRVQV